MTIAARHTVHSLSNKEDAPLLGSVFLFAAHIGNRAGQGVGLLDVGLGNGEVGFNHVQSGMSQDFAQGIDVAAVTVGCAAGIRCICVGR